MFKGSRPQVNRALENWRNLRNSAWARSWDANPDDLRVELAGYWSRLLLRVKNKAKSPTRNKVPKRLGHEFRGIKNVNGGPCQVA